MGEEVVRDMEEEIPGEEVLGAEIQQEQCIRQHVPSAVMIVKFHFNQAVTGQYTAANVLKK